MVDNYFVYTITCYKIVCMYVYTLIDTHILVNYFLMNMVKIPLRYWLMQVLEVNYLYSLTDPSSNLTMVYFSAIILALSTINNMKRNNQKLSKIQAETLVTNYNISIKSKQDWDESSCLLTDSES